MADIDIQGLLDNPRGGVVNLPAGEFEGRFYVRGSCTVNGGGALLWNAAGPVLVIEADNVSVNNLKAELTSENVNEIEYISIFCKGENPRFSEVEVNGSVLGIADEEQYWGMPRVLDLGKLPAERRESFTVEIYAPAEAELRCGIYGIKLYPESLSKGYNTVTLTTDKIRGGSIIYGNIFVISSKTGIVRKITVRGEIGGADDPAPQNYALWAADREAPYNYRKALETLDITAVSAAEHRLERVVLTEEERAPKPAEMPTGDGVEITGGRRIPLAPRDYRIELLCKAMRMKLDVEPYLFMLNDSGRVRNNRDMVFFGNASSPCGSVRYMADGGERAVFVNFRNIPADVSKMSLLFSIYGDKYWQQFNKIVDGEISFLCENGVRLRLKLEKNINCRTILACGFERVDGVWELVPSGKGVAMELPEICRSYGVVVAE